MTGETERPEAEIRYPPPRTGSQPGYRHAPYHRTERMAPSRPLIAMPHSLTERCGPVFGQNEVRQGENDLTGGAYGDGPIGQRIIVRGRVADESGRPVAGTLIELWQANAAGKYHHPVDQRDAPLDPRFTGAGRCVSDQEGRYAFTTIRPGAYPVPDTGNWWRPAHLHFSLFGPSFISRLITQMYFPDDPLNARDKIFSSVTDAAARERLIAVYDHDGGEVEQALGFRFDIVLRGRAATPALD